MERKKDEQMIYIKDLLFAALRRWRTVLAVTLLLALLLGLWKGVSGMGDVKDQAAPEVGNAAQQEAMLQYETEKAALEQKAEAIAVSIENQKSYLDNSVLMQLDPSGYYEAVLSLYCETGYQIMPGMSYQNPDKTEAVLGAYQAVILGNASLAAMAQQIGTEPQYVSELLTVEFPEATDTLVICVKAPTEAAAEKLLSVLGTQVEAAYGQVQTAVSEHSLHVMEQSVSAQVDLTLADIQKKELNRITDLLTSLTETQTKLAALQRPVTQTTSVSAVVKQAVVFAVLGGVLGAFLTVCAEWVLHITSGKVYSDRTLRNRTGVKVIGCVSAEKKKGIDRKLHKLEGRNTAETESQYALLAVDIRCRMENAKHLLVTGSVEAEGLVSALRQAIPGVQVSSGSILDSAAALEMLKACDAVLLVEQCGVSRYSQVDRQTEIICDYAKQLLGCVLLDG